MSDGGRGKSESNLATGWLRDNAHLPGDGLSRDLVVTSNHDDAEASLADIVDGARDGGLRGIDERDQAEEHEVRAGHVVLQ